LNVVLAASSPRIDWGAHFGGFIAGMICCACLDILERALGWLLRCKFPEFVKMNAFCAFVIIVAYCWSKPMAGLSPQSAWVLLLLSAIAGLAVIKMLDLALSMKKGLAVVVVAFALTNGALVLLLRDVLAQTLTSLCAGPLGATNAIAAAVTRACTHVDVTIDVVAMSVFTITMLVYWPQFARGISDVGFVGASLRGERGRRRGI